MQSPVMVRNSVQSKLSIFLFCVAVTLGSRIPLARGLDQPPASVPTFPLQRLEQKTSASPRPVQVGDPILLRIKGIQVPDRLLKPQDLKLSVSEDALQEEGFGWQTELDESEKKAFEEDSKSESGVDLPLKFIPLKKGKLTLPPLDLVDSQGKLLARTQVWEIEVQSAILPSDPKPQEPAGALPPERLAVPYWVLLGGVLLALVLGTALVYSLVRLYQKKRKQVRSPARTLTEDEQALEDFRHLQAQGWLENGQFKAYYFRVSEILKTYFGARFDFDAPESTTGEMIQVFRSQLDLKTPGLTSEWILQVQQLFDHLDRVKFTDYRPLAQEPEWVIRQAHELVVSSRRTPLILDASKGAVHASC
ncbi:MAG: hypothetical protein ACO3A2_04010 [Bdellovibrionia bacterium]